MAGEVYVTSTGFILKKRKSARRKVNKGTEGRRDEERKDEWKGSRCL